MSDDGKTEYRNYNDHSKNMYDFSLIGDISSVGNTIEELLCQAPKLGADSLAISSGSPAKISPNRFKCLRIA